MSLAVFADRAAFVRTVRCRTDSGVRFLEGDRRGLPGHQAPALLGSQDRHNVLNKVALSVQVNMKADLREIYGAPARAAAEAATDVFADKYGR